MKVKKINKLLSVMLAATMCLSAVACGQEEKQKESTAESTKPVEESTSESQMEEPPMYWEMLDEVSDTSELPDWTGDVLEVNVWVAGGSEAIIGEISDTNVTFKELERVTGVRFNPDESFGNNGANIDAMIPRLVAADNFPDIMFTWDSYTQLADLYENGYLVNLTPYYEQGYLDHVLHWTPMDVFGDLVYAPATTEDGECYFIPNTFNIVNSYDAYGYDIEEYDTQEFTLKATAANLAGGGPLGQCIYVREDILQALYPDSYTRAELEQLYIDNGKFTEEEIFDIPLEDLDDFVGMLYDIQELIAGGEYVGLDGRTMEVTFGPHTEVDNWYWMVYLPSFVAGFGAGSDYFTYVDRTAESESDVMVRSIDSPQYKNWMRTLNQLVNDDVMAQNSLVDNSAAFNEKWLNGHYAVLYGGAQTLAQKIDGTEGGWTYRPVWVKTPIDPAVGGVVTGGNTSDGCAIFKGDLTDEQIEQLVHCVDYLNSEIGINLFNWGPASAGLYEVDAEGRREYVNEEVYACMRNNEDNGAALKYGLKKSGTKPTFGTYVTSQLGNQLLAPSYKYPLQKERTGAGAWNFYNSGTVPGYTYNENVSVVKYDSQVYSFGADIEGIKTFWAARSGFEQQMTKTIAAKTENFEKEYSKLIEYADEYGFNAEAVQQFNDKYVEANRTELKAAGIID